MTTWSRDGLEITTDRARLDVDAIHAFLAGESYWARGIPIELVRRSIENSICFGMLDGARQAGFGRVITDRATHAHLCDVYVLPAYRGRGLGRWLMECVMSHPDVQGVRKFSLATRDAHGLYAPFGFAPISRPDWAMEIRRADPYGSAESRMDSKPPPE
jgi:GNAT superfamily N-acetyltransferase